MQPRPGNMQPRHTLTTPNFLQHFVTNYHRTQTKNLRKQAVQETVTSHVSLLTRKLFESYVGRMLTTSGGRSSAGVSGDPVQRKHHANRCAGPSRQTASMVRKLHGQD